MTSLAKGSLLTFFFSLCGAAFIVTHQARERTAAPLPHALFAVVNDQLTAVRAADYAGAYRHAANGLQQKFTPAQFERMVRQNYSHVAEARRVEFGSVFADRRSATVEVFFFTRGGAARCFVYTLTAEGDAWKISDVEELPNSLRAHVPGGSRA